MDSFDLQDELQGLQNLESYEIPGERDIGEENLEELLERKRLAPLFDIPMTMLSCRRCRNGCDQ